MYTSFSMKNTRSNRFVFIQCLKCKKAFCFPYFWNIALYQYDLKSTTIKSSDKSCAISKLMYSIRLVDKFYNTCVLTIHYVCSCCVITYMSVREKCIIFMTIATFIAPFHFRNISVSSDGLVLIFNAVWHIPYWV